MPTKLLAGLLAASFVLVACAKEEPAMEKTMEAMEPVMEEKEMSKL